MKKSNYDTNTGERFVSLSKDRASYKIHIHMPDDTVHHRTVGCIKLGLEKGFKKALKLRNEIGKKAWGKHWNRILNEPHLLTSLPHSLEPIFVDRTERDGKTRLEYQFQYKEYDDKRRAKSHTFRRSIIKHGKMSAYIQVKRKIQEVYADRIDIIRHIERYNPIILQ